MDVRPWARGEQFMKITDSAREKLQTILGENPGKKLRLIFEGFG